MEALELLSHLVHDRDRNIALAALFSAAGLKSTSDSAVKGDGILANSNIKGDGILQLRRTSSQITPLPVAGSPLTLGYRVGLVSQPSEPEERAVHLIQKANQLLDGGLHRCSQWSTVRDMYFNAGALFQSSGMHREAGDSFSHSAAISRVYGSPLEVANAASYAIESYAVCDPVQCRPLLEELIEIQQAEGRVGMAAKYQHELAKNSELLGMDEEALAGYDRAAKAYALAKGSQSGAQQAGVQCQLRASRLAASLERYREAVAGFERLAKSVNSRGLGTTQYYFAATLSLLAESRGENFASGLARAKTMFLDYQDFDPNFQRGVEHQLIRDLLQSFDKPSLSANDDAWEQYWNFRPNSDEWLQLLSTRIRDNLFQYLLPFM